MTTSANIEAETVQVVMRRNEYCERCGARNPFVKWRTVTIDGGKMRYAKCKKCGASCKIFWTD